LDRLREWCRSNRRHRNTPLPGAAQTGATSGGREGDASGQTATLYPSILASSEASGGDEAFSRRLVTQAARHEQPPEARQPDALQPPPPRVGERSTPRRCPEAARRDFDDVQPEHRPEENVFVEPHLVDQEMQHPGDYERHPGAPPPPPAGGEEDDDGQHR